MGLYAFASVALEGSKYDSKLRELSPEEFEEFNKRAEHIEENDEIE